MASAKVEVSKKNTGLKFLSVEKGRKLFDKPFGDRRLLTIDEDFNLGFTGISHKDAKAMTPRQVKDIADSGAISDKLLIGG